MATAKTTNRTCILYISPVGDLSTAPRLRSVRLHLWLLLYQVHCTTLVHHSILSRINDHKSPVVACNTTFSTKGKDSWADSLMTMKLYLWTGRLIADVEGDVPVDEIERATGIPRACAIILDADAAAAAAATTSSAVAAPLPQPGSRFLFDARALEAGAPPPLPAHRQQPHSSSAWFRIS